MQMNWRVWIPVALILAVTAFTYRPAFAQHTVQNLSVFHHGLAPWTTTGSAWGLVNTPRPGPLQPGPRPESQAGGEAATGTIRSPNFVVTGDLIEFLANGWDGHAGHRGFNAYFLKRASDGKILRRAVPPQQDGFVPVYSLNAEAWLAVLARKAKRLRRSAFPWFCPPPGGHLSQ